VCYSHRGSIILAIVNAARADDPGSTAQGASGVSARRPGPAKAGDACHKASTKKAQVTDSSLGRVLEGWRRPFAGYHPCYPSCRQPLAAFAPAVDALRRGM